MYDKGYVMPDLHQKNEVIDEGSTHTSMVALEYITVDEAVLATGLEKRHLRNTAKAAGMTQIGRNSFLRKEFFFYWKYRTQESNKPRLLGEESKQRISRINRQWRFEFERFS